MANRSDVRMAILSDIHAAASPGGKREFKWVVAGDDDPTRNPLAGLADFVASSPDLRADVLLCPGDLCDKADWDSLGYVWTELERIASALEADSIITTPGNHDIDSHEKHSPAGIADGLQQLSPPFPQLDQSMADQFWAKAFTVTETDAWRVVNLNSTLMRPIDKSAGEKDHGLVSREVLWELASSVSSDSRPVNVLLCHHHPLPSTHIVPEDASQMINGDELVRVLDEAPGRWFVVHGHKHEPALNYLGGTADGAIRLASGSVGGVLGPRLSTHVRNQFHIVEFTTERCLEANLSIGGHVRSWTWTAADRWREAVAGDGLPARAGFGYHRAGTELANEVVASAAEAGSDVIEADKLAELVPKLDFLLPRDFQRFVSSLRTDHECRVRMSPDGTIDSIVLP